MKTSKNNVIDNFEKVDIEKIAKLFKEKNSKAKNELEEMLLKWPNSVALKSLKQIYISTNPLNKNAQQFVAHQNGFFSRHQSLRDDIKKQQQQNTAPAMFVEFANSKPLSSTTNHSKYPICQPTGDMIFEAVKKKR